MHGGTQSLSFLKIHILDMSMTNTTNQYGLHRIWGGGVKSMWRGAPGAEAPLQIQKYLVKHSVFWEGEKYTIISFEKFHKICSLTSGKGKGGQTPFV